MAGFLRHLVTKMDKLSTFPDFLHKIRAGTHFASLTSVAEAKTEAAEEKLNV